MVQHVVFNFPLESIHPSAFRAGEAAECAGTQGRFWEMHARLFDAPDAFDDAALLEHALALDMDREHFERCLAGESAATVRADIEEGKRLGVSKTPTFFVGLVEEDGSVQLVRRLNGALTVETFREEISAALGQPLRAARRWWSW